MYIGIHVSTCSSCLVLVKLLNRLSKNTQISNFMKIHPVEAELFHADQHDEANSHAPKMR